MRIHQKRFLVFFIILLIISILAIVFYFFQFQNPRNVLSSLVPSAIAQEEYNPEYVADFQADVTINSDSTVSVRETITYNFSDNQRQGIYRVIPYRYFTAGGRFTVDLNVTGVTDQEGNALVYEVSRNGGNLSVKIGEADQYVSGLQIYVLSYDLRRVINFFDDHDEFYWNVTGNDWEVPIDRSGIVVHLPAGTRAADISADCFTGKYGEQNKDCQITNISNSQVGYSGFNTLTSGEGLTVVLGWPKGILSPPGFFRQLGWLIRDNPLIFLPLLTLLVMLLLWYYHGRDLGRQRTVIPHYRAPSGLNPAEVGSLIDETVNLRDISATFIDLAVRGYLKIKRLEGSGILKQGDWELVKLKDFTGLKQWENDFANDVFGSATSVKLADLKKTFYKHYPKLVKNMYAQLVAEGFFPKSPNKVRNLYAVLAAVLFMLGAIVLPFFNGGLNIVALLISAMIVFWLGRYMPHKTVSGTEAYQKIKGYKLYLRVAEKDRINFHNAPAKTPEVFEQNLAYAMVLGVEKKWAKQFETVYLKQPAWYEGNFASFNAAVLISSLSDFSASSKSALTHGSAAAGGGSGFGGGGFSGGGFGGGGGGSW
jgi:uncharacterized membrane protein